MYLLVSLFALSCAPIQESYYFKTIKNDGSIKRLVNDSLEIKIVPGDFLGIEVTSLSAPDDAFFNSAAASQLQVKGLAKGFVVDSFGRIQYHKLGNVPAAGLTRRQLAETLQAALSEYLKDPLVNVNFLNHKATVLGEVGTPQIIPMPDGKLTLLDALVLSGDVKKDGRRDKIMIIRENDTARTVKYVNLENHSVFNSPYYYLRPNDVVYVLPNSELNRREENKRRLQTTLSLVASAAGLLIIILDRVLK